VRDDAGQPGHQGIGKDTADLPGTRIPEAIKTQVADRITAFNRAVIQDPQVYYLPRYRGAFLYLDRYDYGQVGAIGRLTYTGALDRWEFAIYRYSEERYAPDEWLFPGASELDGTVEGAMRAGLAAYPP
jgi:hypothetical protein